MNRPESSSPASGAPSELARESLHGRPWLVASTALSALAFGWAALVLPWRPSAPLGWLAWGLAALQACASATLVFRPERAERALRFLAFASLGAAPIFALALAITSWQLVHFFGPLGWALTVALAAIGWLLLLGTLPLGIFLLRRARHGRG